MQVSETTLFLTAARAGDQEAFRSLTDPYRRELLVHCYRMLGSVEDAEDMVQEALLRAWRRLETFEGRGTLRSWLYKIATNLSLDALEQQRRRWMPPTTMPAADPLAPIAAPTGEYLWLEPLPDSLIDLRPDVNPEAFYDVRESVTLAFLIALQSLPGRQRAVLLLRDVIGWHANEIADMLGMTLVAVNSALQRARATMTKVQDGGDLETLSPAENAQTAELLAQYIAAWESADASRLVALLAEGAVLTMPPMPTWYQGRSAIHYFLQEVLFKEECMRLIATRANSAPAFAVYKRENDGLYRAVAIQILTLRQGQIAQIDDFISGNEEVFARFGLSVVL